MINISSLVLDKFTLILKIGNREKRIFLNLKCTNHLRVDKTRTTNAST